MQKTREAKQPADGGGSGQRRLARAGMKQQEAEALENTGESRCKTRPGHADGVRSPGMQT